MRLFKLSLVLNFVFTILLIFGVYYKRASIINRIDKIYYSVFENKTAFEENILVFNQSPFKGTVKYINADKFEKRFKVAILGNSISAHGAFDGWDMDIKQGEERGMASSALQRDWIHILLNKISEEKEWAIEYIVINIADFERNFEQFDHARLEMIKKFEPEVLIFQIGENVSAEKLLTGMGGGWTFCREIYRNDKIF
jgi:hypothetical protein